MKSFLKTRSVCSGMVWLLDAFCEKNLLKSPVNHIYNVEDRILFNRWLKKLKYIDQQYQKEGLGLEIAKLCNPSHIGISSYIAASCKSLNAYIGLPLQYISIWYDYMYKDVSFADEEIIISWETPAYYRAGLYTRETAISEELQVAIIYCRVLQITGNAAKVFNKVELAIPKPQNVKLYEDFFNCPVSFNAERTLFKVAQYVFEIPLSSEDPILFQLLKKQADVMMGSMPKKITFLENVNQAIIKSINQQDPRIGLVATYLNMNTRSLQNALKEEGFRFQDLLNEARLTLAKQYLLKKNMSIVEISNLLGYQEQTSFNRVFKSWTGDSPMRWRELNMPK